MDNSRNALSVILIIIEWDGIIPELYNLNIIAVKLVYHFSSNIIRGKGILLCIVTRIMR